MFNAVIVKAKRTPIGKVNGQFKHIPPQQLMTPILRNLVEGLTVPIDDVILGNVVGPGGNVARFSVLEAGLPMEIPGMTIDRQCSAGLEAIRLASYFIKSGAGQCYIAGGVESASTSPFSKRAQFSPKEIGDPDMVEAAENVARKFYVSKEQQDTYALTSYERTWRAFESEYLQQEIIPIQQLQCDEELYKKRDLSILLKRIRPLLKDGTVTAANSCGIHDGASAVLVMEEELAIQQGFQPVLRFIDSVVVGNHPNYPGAAPIPAIQQLLKKQQLTVEQIDLFEINEAFASKIVACMQELNIPFEKINCRGGALTIGHPYGASGGILITRLFYEVQRRENLKYVVAAIGSGGGIGVAVLLEVVV